MKEQHIMKDTCNSNLTIQTDSKLLPAAELIGDQIIKSERNLKHRTTSANISMHSLRVQHNFTHLIGIPCLSAGSK